MLGFQSFQSANKALKGIEAMNMIKKRQVNNLNYSVLNEVKYINHLLSLIHILTRLFLGLRISILIRRTQFFPKFLFSLGN